MKLMKLLFLLTLALLCGNDDAGYVLEMNLEKPFRLDMESVVEFSTGTWTYYQLMSARISSEFEKPNAYTGERKMIQGFTKVIASSRRNDEMKPLHEMQKLNNTSFTMIIDSLGFIVSTVANNDISQEVLDESEEVNFLFGVNSDRQNIKYFLGGDEVRRVGDVWSTADTTDEVPNTYGFDKFRGSQITKNKFELKKIKEKKGDLIASIKCTSTLDISGVGTTWDETIEFSQSGEFSGTIKFNITKGYIVLNKVNGLMTIRGKDLEDDSSYNISIDIALKQKGKQK